MSLCNNSWRAPRGRHRSYIQNTKYYLKKFNVSTDNRYSLCKDDVEKQFYMYLLNA